MEPEAIETSGSSPVRLREALIKEYPEIQRLYSDRYLLDVLSVKGRTFEYACNEKLRKSLDWRRAFGIDRLCSRFRYDMQGGIFELLPATGNVDSQGAFTPSPALLELCKGGALRILPKRDQAGHIVLHAETQLIDWQAVGVEAGIQYHVLVIEAALKMMRSDNGQSPESMVLLVDTTGPMFARPPPIDALQSLVSLLQLAYPDRIHQICVGPVNFMVRGLYNIVARFLSSKSRQKIKLVSNRPKEGYLFGASDADRNHEAACPTEKEQRAKSHDVQNLQSAISETDMCPGKVILDSCDEDEDEDVSTNASETDISCPKAEGTRRVSFAAEGENSRGVNSWYWFMFQSCYLPSQDVESEWSEQGTS